MQEIWVWYLDRVKKIPWSRKWQPTSVFLPGKFHWQRSLVAYSSWGCKELDKTEQLSTHTHLTVKWQNWAWTLTFPLRVPWVFHDVVFPFHSETPAASNLLHPPLLQTMTPGKVVFIIFLKGKHNVNSDNIIILWSEWKKNFAPVKFNFYHKTK